MMVTSRLKFGVGLVCATALLVILILNNTAVMKVGQSGGISPIKSRHFSAQKFQAMQEQHQNHERRRMLVKGVCNSNDIEQNKKSFKPSKFQHIYVDDRHKFLYCAIPKVACTNWKRILVVLSGKVKTTNPGDLPPALVHNTTLLGKYLKALDSYSTNEIMHRVKNYYKFMFVRNPMERLLSAYRNKFVLTKSDYFRTYYGRKIVRRVRPSPSTDSSAIGTAYDISFSEFIQYLLDMEEKKKQPLNEHWEHYYKLCHPCLIDYDTIGKYETLYDDVSYVLRRAKVDSLLKFPKANRYRGPLTRDILKENYANVSKASIHKLWEMFSVDFAMFGYDYPQFIDS